MKNLKDLFQAEFKNLYAMEKQIMENLEPFPEASHKKLNKALGRISKSNSNNFEKIKSMNSAMDLNPGSTTDSIVQEMLENIKEISNKGLPTKLSEAGLLASFNRLANYRVTNYYIAYRMAKVAKLKKEAKGSKKLWKRSRKDADKLMACSKKSVFKEARG